MSHKLRLSLFLVIATLTTMLFFSPGALAASSQHTLQKPLEPQRVTKNEAVLGEFGYVYNASAQTVALHNDVTFDSNGTLTTNIIHAVGTSAITLVLPGTYLIRYSITAQSVSQFALTLNGNVVPGSTYETATSSPAQVNGTGIVVTTTANSVLTLRNNSSFGPVDLDFQGGGTAANVDASIVIEQLL